MGLRNSENVSATVRRWQLAVRLHEYREAAGMTIDQATEELRKGSGRWSRSKVSRVENREHNLKPTELDQLLDVYGISDRDIRRELHKVAAKANERGWWVSYRGSVPGRIHPFLDLESAMVEMREYQAMLVPGLLQTPDYARALFTEINPNLSPDQIDLKVAGRMARQQVLERQPAPKLHMVVHQILLEQEICHPEIMLAQLRRLIEATGTPNITVQVLPKLTAVSHALEGSFAIITLPEPVPDIGYTEGPGGSVYIEDRGHVRDLIMRFGTIAQTALPAGDSVDVIAKAAQSYE